MSPVDPLHKPAVDDVDFSVTEKAADTEGKFKLSVTEMTDPKDISFPKIRKGFGYAGMAVGGLGYLIGATLTVAAYTVDTVFAIVVWGDLGPDVTSLKFTTGFAYHAGRMSALVLGGLGAGIAAAGGANRLPGMNVKALGEIHHLERSFDHLVRKPGVLTIKPLRYPAKDPYASKQKGPHPDFEAEVKKRGEPDFDAKVKRREEKDFEADIRQADFEAEVKRRDKSDSS